MNQLLRCMAVVVCLALAFGAGCRPADDDRWVTVRRGDLVVGVEVNGTLAAVDSSSIGPPGLPGVWNYKIAMLSPEGEAIEKGKPLLGFDTTELRRRLDQKTGERDTAAKQLEKKLASVQVARTDAALALAEARAALRKAGLKAEEVPGVTASIELKKLTLDLELATKKVKYLQAKNRSTRRRDDSEISSWRNIRDRAEARVKEIGAAIEQMTLIAPRAGTVIYETNWRGEKKKVGDSAWRGQSVLQVASLAEMEAKGEVDEVDVSKVQNGQRVALKLDAQPDLELWGVVRNVSGTVQRRSPETPLKIVRLDIKLELAEGARLRPGMRFQGRIETDKAQDTLLVPVQAIVATPEGPIGYRRTGSGSEAVAVTIGRRDGNLVEVLQGLEEGDQLDRQGAGPPTREHAG